MQTVTLGKNEIVVNKRVFNDMLKVSEEIEGIIETLDIINDRELLKGIERSKKQVKEGRTHELKTVDDLDKVWSTT